MDAGQAYIAERHSKLEVPQIIQAFTHDHSKTQDHETDSPGRVFESGGINMRHAYEKKHDWHEMQKEDFARQLSKIINDSHKKFDELFVIAPPRILGFLRDNLSKEATVKIKKELPKDITHLPIADLGQYLELE